MRAESAGSGGTPQELPARLETLLPTGADAEGVPGTRRVDTAPVAGIAAQALAAGKDDVPGAEGDGCDGGDRPDGGRKQPTMVA